MSGATVEDSGLASGLVNTTIQVGGALGLAVLATLSTTRTAHLVASGTGQTAALTGGYHLAWLVSAGIAAAALAIATPLLKSVRPGAPADAGDDEDADVVKTNRVDPPFAEAA
jgi:hypothetical protein